MDKGKMIFIGVVALVGLFIVFYMISFISGDKQGGSTSDFYVPEVVKEESKDHYKSRLEKANEHRNPKTDDNFGSNVDFKVYQSDSLDMETVNPDMALAAEEEEEAPTPVRSNNTRRSYQPKAQTASSTPAPAQQTSTAAEVEQKEERKGGFGIVRNESTSVDDKSASTPIAPSNEFYPVMLETAVTIKDNTNVVFILLDDLIVQGKRFSKNAFAFGKAKMEDYFFDVHIYQIKNTDGKMYNVEGLNLFIFDENYSRGFKFEGNLNEGVREGAMEGAGATSTSALGVVDAGARVADRVISNVTRKKDPTVSLLRGYRIYVKPTK